MIDILATEGHWLDHLTPIHAALGAHAGAVLTDRHLPSGGDVTVVASYRDMKNARKHGRPVALAEHGAGQSYQRNGRPASQGSYIGSLDRDGVIAVLVPGEAQATVHRAAHPDLPVHVVGCPKLDQLALIPRPVNARPVVAVSWHWDCKLVPETTSAWRFYRAAVAELSRTHQVLGHGHPRLWPQIRGEYERMGIEPVRDFAEVVARADVLAVDNSSVMFEWAALDRPVVVVNSPKYRRNVHHGGRFWEWADVGLQVDRPDQLATTVDKALLDPLGVAVRRREIVRDIYGQPAGSAAQRAAEAVIQAVQEVQRWPHQGSPASDSTGVVSANS